MMERRVKERLIGASIMVVIIVGVVPEFLSGPKRIAVAPPLTPPGQSTAVNEVRNVTVDLATSKATAVAAEPPMAAALDAAAPPTEPAASALLAPPATALPVPVPPLQSVPPAAQHRAPVEPHPAAAAPLESATAPPRSSEPGEAAHRGWSVQLGVFASKANADNLVRQLKSQGAAVYVIAGGSKSTARYKVRVGPVADRGSAERSLAKLKSQGHAGSLVGPDS